MLPYHTIPCHIISYHVIPYKIIPYQSIYLSFMHLHMRVSAYIYPDVYIYICTHMYAYAHVFTRVYICIHIFASNQEHGSYFSSFSIVSGGASLQQSILPGRLYGPTLSQCIWPGPPLGPRSSMAWIEAVGPSAARLESQVQNNPSIYDVAEPCNYTESACAWSIGHMSQGFRQRPYLHSDHYPKKTYLYSPNLNENRWLRCLGQKYLETPSKDLDVSV